MSILYIFIQIESCRKITASYDFFEYSKCYIINRTCLRFPQESILPKSNNPKNQLIPINKPFVDHSLQEAISSIQIHKTRSEIQFSKPHFESQLRDRNYPCARRHVL
uniref:(northern house mosquito) hypothetical protein n=1 Tax=Culex pipiens TaxID=7175 RepID=A0A8D8G0K2_CULPI